VPVRVKRVSAPPGRIETTLKDLWRNASGAVEGNASEELEQSRAKVCLANVVLLLGDNSPLTEELVTSITVRYPSRLFIVQNAANGEQLTAEVSSRCLRATTGTSVCSEEIYLYAGSKKCAALPNLILSLLVPDVPTLLVYYDPATKECFESLALLAEVCVVDSSKWASSQEFLAWVRQQSAEIFDVSWQRQAAWRHALKDCFDFPVLDSALAEVSRVAVVSSSDATSAVFIGAYMLEALGLDCSGDVISLVVSEEQDSLAGIRRLQVFGATEAILELVYDSATHQIRATNGPAYQLPVVPSSIERMLLTELVAQDHFLVRSGLWPKIHKLSAVLGEA